MTQPFKDRMSRFWRHYARPFLFVAIVLTAFRSSIADWNDVPTGSMKPTILEGDRVFVNKLAYDLKVPFTTWHLAEWAGPSRGDIIVFYSPADGRRLVKRVVAVAGDTVEMVGGRVIINGQVAQYEPLDASVADQLPPAERPMHELAAETFADQRHPVMSTPAIPATRSFAPVRIPTDHCFVMGDNRDNSYDSRYFGPVPRGQVLGRASAVLLSVDLDNYLMPRWSRFFSSLP